MITTVGLSFNYHDGFCMMLHCIVVSINFVLGKNLLCVMIVLFFDITESI